MKTTRLKTGGQPASGGTPGNAIESMHNAGVARILLPALAFFIIASMQLVSCTGHVQNTEPVKVIFDTDMGNDIDDALALDMLYKYADWGKVELLAITSNKEEPQSVEYIDIMNTFYGYPDIPVGKITDGAFCDRVNSYTSVTSADTSYARTISDYTALPESVDLMRKTLAGQDDNSVVIIAVGFSTNLQRLMHSGPDEISEMTGMELIRKKVRGLYMMAGEFEDTAGKSEEYNIRTDRKAAEEVFSAWPTDIVTSPFEVGSKILYPVSSILNDFKYAGKHPLVEAYKVYKPMPYDRPMWDPSAVLYAIEPDMGYFSLSGPGKITVDQTSMTWFSPEKEGKHRYLKIEEPQQAKALGRMLEIITATPAVYIQ